MSGGAALAESLIANGLTTLFALPGAQIDNLFSALHDAAPRIRVMTSRHEQGAAYMALGAARSTGRPAAFAVVPGPGWLNASAALLTAYGCNAPVLSIAGQVPSPSIGSGLGELHEMPDQLAMARGITKWAARIEHPSLAPSRVREAMSEMLKERPRPVHLEMAPDVLGAISDVDLSQAVGPHPVPLAPDSESVEAAAALLAKAERPLIFVGGGAQHASAEVRDLARRLGAPVTAFRSGRGVMDETDELFLPYAAAHKLWAEADVVLAIGTRLDFPRRMWGSDAGLKIIRVDVDPAEMLRISRPDIAIVADSAVATAALSAALAGRAPASRLSEFRALKADTIAAFDRDTAPQMGFLRAIRSALPDDGFFVDELTQVGYMSWSWFPTRHPRHYVSSGYQGTLGYGVATALGVQAANPDRAVVAVSGDGGFLFAGSELATAAKYNLPVVWVVFADGHFGNVRRIQNDRYGGRLLGSDLRNPDFVAYARSFGLAADRIEDPAALQARVAAAIAAREPTVIEVPVGDLPTPWNHIVKPANRGPLKVGT
jgi:acetolactate synthase-1/2/3 large subunit